MIDRSKRRAIVKREGSMIVIHMKGGPDCLWLNMYLDTDGWQMTCDSDVGHYAYNWASGASAKDFVSFCCDWLADEHWLLRKCVDERHGERAFDVERTVDGIKKICMEYGDDDFDADLLDDVIDAAYSFSQSADAWSAAIQLIAEGQGVELPEEWYECICTDYTPQQKRFAEICRETIVPELKRLCDEEGTNGDGKDGYTLQVPMLDKHGKPTGEVFCIGKTCISRKPTADVAAGKTGAGAAVEHGEPGILPVGTARVVDLARIPVITEGEKLNEHDAL